MTIEFSLTNGLTPGFKRFNITKRENGSAMVDFAINLNLKEIQDLVMEIFTSVTLEEYSKITKVRELDRCVGKGTHVCCYYPNATKGIKKIEEDKDGS